MAAQIPTLVPNWNAFGYHLIQVGKSSGSIDQADDKDDLFARIREEAESNEEDIILGYGVRFNPWTDGYPTAAMPDEIESERTVFFWAIYGHVAWVNSKIKTAVAGGNVKLIGSMRIFLVAVLALLVAGGAYWYYSGARPLVEVVEPIRGKAAEVVYATGIIEPVHWAKIASLQRRRIVELCKCEGEPVKEGDVLAKLDDAEEQALLRQLEARLKRLQADAERIKRLFDREIASRTVYDEILTKIDEHEARIAAQRDRIDDLELKAPIDGVVLRRDGEVGEIAGIGANEALIWVGKEKPLQVVAEINEDDIGKVSVGQKVLLRHESHRDTPLNATLDRITPQGDPDTKTFRAYLSLPDDSPLMIGMSVEANIIVAEKQDALLLPAEAISGGQVQLVVNGNISTQKVETGIRGTRFVEIIDGLPENALVVSAFREELRDRSRIRVASPSS